jgi:hypothetical protein
VNELEMIEKLSQAILAALLSMPEQDMIQAMKDWTNAPIL